MAETPQPTPEEQDRITESRTLSDAELIRDGAAYEGGVLRPTQDQIEKLQRPDEARSELRSLYSRIEVESDKPLHELMSAAENLAALGDRQQSIVEPFSGIFADKVPENPGLFRRSGSTKWDERFPSKLGDLRYEFKVDYSKKTAETAKITCRRDNYAADYYQLKIQLDSGQPSKIELSGDASFIDNYCRTGDHQALSRLLTSYNWYEDSRLTLDLQSHSLEGVNGREDLNFRYELNETNSQFREALNGRGQLSTDQYLALVQDMLNLIPTR